MKRYELLKLQHGDYGIVDKETGGLCKIDKQILIEKVRQNEIVLTNAFLRRTNNGFALVMKSSTPKPIVLLRGGDGLDFNIIICKSIAEAKGIVQRETRENVASGAKCYTNITNETMDELSVVSNEDSLYAILRVASDVSDIKAITVTEYGDIQWWVLARSDSIILSSDYNL